MQRNEEGSDEPQGAGQELSVVLPCLNEAETIEVCVKKALTSMRENDIDGEVIVADNGSTDGSQELATNSGARVVDVPARGYGAAIRGGIAASDSTFIIMADADDSYDLANLHEFVFKLREGHDLVMGNRFRGGIKPGAMPFLHRYLGNPVLSFIGRLFFNSDIGDFHCGMRGFRRESILSLDLRTTGMEFASEMIVKAELAELDIAEIPTTLSPDGRSGEPHLNTWRDGWRHLRFLLLYSPRWLFIYPGVVAIALGLVVASSLYVVGPISLGPVTLSGIHSIFYAALAILLGFQGLWFGLFSRVFAANAGLLPPSARPAWVDRMPLEAGLVIGTALAILGLTGAAYEVVSWQQASFGAFDPTKTFPVLIPSFLGCALGIQIVLSSFFLAVLNLDLSPAPNEVSPRNGSRG